MCCPAVCWTYLLGCNRYNSVYRHLSKTRTLIERFIWPLMSRSIRMHLEVTPITSEAAKRLLWQISMRMTLRSTFVQWCNEKYYSNQKILVVSHGITYISDIWYDRGIHSWYLFYILYHVWGCVWLIKV